MRTHLFLLPLFLASLPLRGLLAAPPLSPTCPDNLDSPIANFCQVTPDLLWRGAKPDVAGMAWLIQRGVKSIVNLELLHDDRGVMAQVRLDAGGRYLVGYYRIPDWEPLPLLRPDLTDKHVAQFIALMGQIPKPAFVHCRSGENRTGLMVAAYRVIVEGAGDPSAIERAVAEMKSYDGVWFKPHAAYLRGLTPERQMTIRRLATDWANQLQPTAQANCQNGRCQVHDIRRGE